MTCPGCGGIVGQDCWNPQECEWISRDMAARHAAQAEVEPLLHRIAELEGQVRTLSERGVIKHSRQEAAN